MPLSVIHGKPRSGKTCYCVSLLSQKFEDWARYEIANGQPYPRKLYTNIPLDIDAVNQHIECKVGKFVDLSDQIVLLDDEFFFDEGRHFREWWTDFEVGALIVIDEVHHYLPASVKFQQGGMRHADRFMEFVSMHGHAQQDLIFLTQHVGNVSTEVRKQIETIFEVLNVKNQVFGFWPFTIPMQDMDVVRESWDVATQVAHIKRGICTAGRIEYEKACEVFLLHPGIFKLYRSHTKSDDTFDRPSLKMGKLGSILWLCRRHAMRLGMWLLVTLTVLGMIANFMYNLPTIISSSMKTNPKTVQAKPTPTLPAPRVVEADGTVRAPVVTDPVDDGIIGFVRGGVITPRSKRSSHERHFVL